MTKNERKFAKFTDGTLRVYAHLGGIGGKTEHWDFYPTKEDADKNPPYTSEKYKRFSLVGGEKEADEKHDELKIKGYYVTFYTY